MGTTRLTTRTAVPTFTLSGNAGQFEDILAILVTGSTLVVPAVFALVLYGLPVSNPA